MASENSADEPNPLLITPPPGLLPAPTPRAAPESAGDDPEEFITLPPGIADSATHRVAAPRVVPIRAEPSRGVPGASGVPGGTEPGSAEPVGTDEIVFFPMAPGVPSTPPVAPSTIDPAVPSAVTSGVDMTPSTWRLTLPGGETVSIASAVIVGRDPAPRPGRADAALLPAFDPAKSLSKTHALLEVVDGLLWVHDLDSTNGVFVAAPGAGVVQVDPGTRALVPDGADIELGEYIVTALRG